MQVYKSLADCYFQPDEKLVQAVQRINPAIEEWDQDLLEPALEMQKVVESRDKEMLDLKKEYSRLFVGPFELAVPPYGSIYFQHNMQNQQIMDDSAVKAQNAYRKAGVNMSEDFNDPPDHIAVELEFMYYLLYHENQALENKDQASAIDFRTQRLDFLKRHLGLWGPVFADTLFKNTSSDFYRHLARLTKSVILKDKQELGLTRPS